MKKPKSKIPKSILSYVLSILFGLVFGALMYFVFRASGVKPEENTPAFFLNLFISTLFSFFLHIIIHEGGHLVMGLLTGYKFQSFRVGSLTLARYENEGLKWKKYQLAGTGGQCLLSPPGKYGEAFPYKLYFYGGALFNALFGALALAIIFIAKPGASIAEALFFFFLIGLVLAVVNIISIKDALIINDGTSVRILNNNQDSLKYFWLQLKISALEQNGMRLKDMPGEYFVAGGAMMPLPQPSGYFMKTALWTRKSLTRLWRKSKSF